MTDTTLRPSYLRVLKLLSRGYILHQIDDRDYASLDWGPISHASPAGGPNPDNVHVSRPMFDLFRGRRYVRVLRREAVGSGWGTTWGITDAGRAACTPTGARAAVGS